MPPQRQPQQAGASPAGSSRSRRLEAPPPPLTKCACTAGSSAAVLVHGSALLLDTEWGSAPTHAMGAACMPRGGMWVQRHGTGHTCYLSKGASASTPGGIHQEAHAQVKPREASTRGCSWVLPAFSCCLGAFFRGTAGCGAGLDPACLRAAPPHRRTPF
jgi:hypothetical protein